jgi:N4-gp56 family major capsid protein
MVVQISDMLVSNSAVETVRNAALEVRNAVARQLDVLAQSTVCTSSTASQIIYAGGKSNRSALAAGDAIEPTLIMKAVTKLQSANAIKMGEVANGIIHPNVSGDLKANTTVGGYLGFYTNVEDVKKHSLGTFRGAAFLDSANVQPFTSNVAVYPTMILGSDPYGWGYFQAPTVEMVNSADSSNPLNLYTSIGMKAAIGLTRLQEEKMVRIESASLQ